MEKDEPLKKKRFGKITFKRVIIGIIIISIGYFIGNISISGKINDDNEQIAELQSYLDKKNKQVSDDKTSLDEAADFLSLSIDDRKKAIDYIKNQKSEQDKKDKEESDAKTKEQQQDSSPKQPTPVTTSTEPAPQPESKTESKSGKMVWVTPNGKSYHMDKTCPTLGRSKGLYQETIEQAQSEGKTPCGNKGD